MIYSMQFVAPYFIYFSIDTCHIPQKEQYNIPSILLYLYSQHFEVKRTCGQQHLFVFRTCSIREKSYPPFSSELLGDQGYKQTELYFGYTLTYSFKIITFCVEQFIICYTYTHCKTPVTYSICHRIFLLPIICCWRLDFAVVFLFISNAILDMFKRFLACKLALIRFFICHRVL